MGGMISWEKYLEIFGGGGPSPTNLNKRAGGDTLVRLQGGFRASGKKTLGGSRKWCPYWEKKVKERCGERGHE